MEITTIGISKNFGSVKALENVNFNSKAGEIHGLLGENGAGKTTLMNIVYGLYQPTEGEILIDGSHVKFNSPADGIKAGIGMVHQQSTLVAEFTALENIVLGHPRIRLKDLAEIKEKIKDLSSTYGMFFPLNTEVGLLDIGVKQKIEIIRAIFRGANTLILDEPTTTLTEIEFEKLKESLIMLAKQDKTIILITHKIREVFGICDQITVLRNGKLQSSFNVKDITQKDCINAMFGNEDIEVNSASLPILDYKPAKRTLNPILKIDHLKTKISQHCYELNDINLEVYGGEILGLAGISGNGQKELVDALFKSYTWLDGDIKIDGESIRNLSTVKIFNLGVSFTPEDRIKEGIIPNKSLTKNVFLHHYANRKFLLNRYFINWEAVSKSTRKIIQEYNVATPNEEIEIRRLSGGNIQKMVLGRALLDRTRILITHNPTFGVDISTVDFIFNNLIAIRDNGGAIFFINEDLDELMCVCDRIAVINSGRIISIFNRKEFDKYEIGAMMIGDAQQQ